MILFNAPRFVPLPVYEDAIGKVVDHLARRADVRAVYQLGSTGSPGISDIDLLVVSNGLSPDGVNPFTDLNDDQRYLFTHGIFGIPETDFRHLRRYSMYHNYRLLWGTEPAVDGPGLNPEEERVLKEQIALEFLLSNYIARVIDLSYGVTNLRGLLLSGHALRYDLDFLGISSGPLHEMVSELISWRSAWFEGDIHARIDHAWLAGLCRALRNLLETRLHDVEFCLPCNSPTRLARHIRLEKADAVGFERKGLRFSLSVRVLRSRAKKVMNRTNRFRFMVPYRSEPTHPILSERFAFLARMFALDQPGPFSFQVPANNLLRMILHTRRG